MKHELDKQFMHQALGLARDAYEFNEVPVGALYVLDGEIVSKSCNRVETTPGVLEHAELRVIREASEKLSKWRLLEGTLYVTLEPCVMCAGAIRTARIPRIVYGAKDIRLGGFGSMVSLHTESVFGKVPEVVGGVCEEESGDLLRSFFREKREKR